MVALSGLFGFVLFPFDWFVDVLFRRLMPWTALRLRFLFSCSFHKIRRYFYKNELIACFTKFLTFLRSYFFLTFCMPFGFLPSCTTFCKRSVQHLGALFVSTLPLAKHTMPGHPSIKGPSTLRLLISLTNASAPQTRKTGA